MVGRFSILISTLKSAPQVEQFTVCSVILTLSLILTVSAFIFLTITGIIIGRLHHQHIKMAPPDSILKYGIRGRDRTSNLSLIRGML